VWRTLPYAFTQAGHQPSGTVALVVDAPDGSVWTFGEPNAPTVVRGSAVALCEVAGQRCQAGDTDLSAQGPDATAALTAMRTFA
jgi:hypothetical protein